MSSHPPAIDAHNSALFLDVDGTLLDIEEHPDDVVADDEIISLLLALQTELDAAIALVSGRTIEEIDRVFSPHRFPAAGEHGARIRWPDGSIEATEHDALPESVIERAMSFATERKELLLEKKPAGVALHYRAAPHMQAECRRFMKSLQADIGDGVRLLEGKMVFELTPGGSNKGAAVSAFLAAPPFKDQLPVYIGDDVTDEDAFDAVNRAGGYSVRVGHGDETAARYALPDVAAVRQWLADATRSADE